jgi:myo-inositol 2-dehydrogenase / D-chiro-inositol 1-dehydrogenase
MLVAMTVRVGVIGAGIMGADHASTLHRQVKGATVTMVADLDLARARAVAAALPEARATDDGFGLIGDPAVDAVVVASADATHADLTVAAVQAGKPVLCEKPLAPTLPECLRVVGAEAEAVGAGGPPLVSVGFMRRFDPGYLELRSALEAGACGTPLLVHCVSRGVASGPGSTSESSVTGSAIHELDTVPWLLGAPVVEVGWHAPRPTAAAPGMQDPQLLLLRTADGVLTTVEVFLNARYGYDIRCEVVGDRGAIALTNPARVVADADRRRATGYPADWRPRFADAYRAELQAWVDAVTAGQAPPLASARDGLVAGAVAEAVITSMGQDGRRVPVQVPALDGPVT